MVLRRTIVAAAAIATTFALIAGCKKEAPPVAETPQSLATRAALHARDRRSAGREADARGHQQRPAARVPLVDGAARPRHERLPDHGRLAGQGRDPGAGFAQPGRSRGEAERRSRRRVSATPASVLAAPSSFRIRTASSARSLPTENRDHRMARQEDRAARQLAQQRASHRGQARHARPDPRPRTPTTCRR